MNLAPPGSLEIVHTIKASGKNGKRGEHVYIIPHRREIQPFFLGLDFVFPNRSFKDRIQVWLLYHEIERDERKRIEKLRPESI